MHSSQRKRVQKGDPATDRYDMERIFQTDPYPTDEAHPIGQIQGGVHCVCHKETIQHDSYVGKKRDEVRHFAGYNYI